LSLGTTPTGVCQHHQHRKISFPLLVVNAIPPLWRSSSKFASDLFVQKSLQTSRKTNSGKIPRQTAQRQHNTTGAQSSSTDQQQTQRQMSGTPAAPIPNNSTSDPSSSRGAEYHSQFFFSLSPQLPVRHYTGSHSSHTDRCVSGSKGVLT
jgi:hypothetical protein